MGRNKDKVLRHTLLVRLNHWLIALSGLVLVFSGMGEFPMYKRYNVTKIPGLSWAGDFWLQLDMHYYASMIFMASVFFHMLFHFMQREFAIMPRRGDASESARIMWAMLTGGKEPEHDKFLAEQRLAYAAIGVTTIVLIATGLVKAFKNIGPIVLDPDFLFVVTMLHTASTMLFVLLIIAHLGAFLIKANRPLVESIFTGKVRAEYARDRHGKWNHNS